MLGVVGVLCLYVGGLTVVITREIVREYYEHRRKEQRRAPSSTARE